MSQNRENLINKTISLNKAIVLKRNKLRGGSVPHHFPEIFLINVSRVQERASSPSPNEPEVQTEQLDLMDDLFLIRIIGDGNR